MARPSEGSVPTGPCRAVGTTTFSPPARRLGKGKREGGWETSLPLPPRAASARGVVDAPGTPSCTGCPSLLVCMPLLRPLVFTFVVIGLVRGLLEWEGGWDSSALPGIDTEGEAGRRREEREGAVWGTTPITDEEDRLTEEVEVVNGKAAPLPSLPLRLQGSVRGEGTIRGEEGLAQPLLSDSLAFPTKRPSSLPSSVLSSALRFFSAKAVGNITGVSIFLPFSPVRRACNTPTNSARSPYVEISSESFTIELSTFNLMELGKKCSCWAMEVFRFPNVSGTGNTTR